LASTEHGHNLRVWEIAAGQAYRTLTASPLAGKKGFLCCHISADGSLLAGGASGGFGLWDMTSGDNLTFTAWPGGHQVLFESPAALLTASSEGTFRRPFRRDPATGAIHFGVPEKLPLPGADCVLALSADGKVLASAQFDGALVLYADQPTRPIRLGPHDDVRNVQVSSDGRWIATDRFSLPGGVKVWDARTRTLEKDLPVGIHSFSVFSPDGKRLLTGDGSGEIRVWEVGTWTEVLIREPLRGQQPAFSVDGKLLAVETGTGVARLLDPQTGKEYARLEDPNQDHTYHFSFSRDGTKLVCATPYGNCLHVWDLQALRRDLAEMGLDWK
jgi:WD40 repeat protein